MLEYAEKKRCNTGKLISGDAKIRRLLEEKETQKILLGRSLMDTEQC